MYNLVSASGFCDKNRTMESIYFLYLKNIFTLLLTIMLATFVHKGLLAVEYNTVGDVTENLQPMHKDNSSKSVPYTNFASVDINEWAPLQMTNGDDFTFGNFGLVILNTPIRLKQMVRLWNRAEFRVTVNGGTNQWYKFQKNLSTILSLIERDPNVVVGNLHSIDKDTLQECYRNGSVKVIKTNSEHSDFASAIDEITEHSKHNKLDSVLVITEHAGRLDQLLFNIGTLNRPGISIFLLTKNSLSWVLHSGFHNIHIPMRVWQPNSWCGLIPLFGSTLVTTSGLKWNLKNQYLQFGGLISTSNTYGDVSFQREGVTITTNKNLLWTMGLPADDN